MDLYWLNIQRGNEDFIEKFRYYVDLNGFGENLKNIDFTFEGELVYTVESPEMFLKFFTINEIAFDCININLKDKSIFRIFKRNSDLNGSFYSNRDFQILNSLFFSVFSDTKYSYLHESLDFSLSREGVLRVWKHFNRKIPTYAKLKSVFDFDNKNAQEIVLESLPGHVHNSYWEHELWFGACWQMYFSELYYVYIPKPIFDNFKDCEENVILGNGVRRITLYKKPDDYDLPESRARQWAFRHQLGIDTIGHEIGEGDNPIDDNLPIYITKQDCQFGQTKVTKYLNKKMELVNKKNAFYAETKEYLDDGITIVFDETKEVKKGFFDGFFSFA